MNRTIAGCKPHLVLFGAALAGVAALAACTGGNGGVAPADLPCTLPSGVQAALAYPAPNSQGVSDSLNEVVVAFSSPLPSSWYVYLLDSNGNLIQDGALSSPIPVSSIPPGYVAPSFANPVYQSAQTAPLFTLSNTSVSVLLDNSAVFCNDFPSTGSFALQ